jgi:hypothetical protein
VCESHYLVILFILPIFFKNLMKSTKKFNYSTFYLYRLNHRFNYETNY